MIVQPHEKKAMEEMVINTRAMVDVLGGRQHPHCIKLMVWAQILEEFLDRVDQEQK
jgi:hypothetical protein